MNENNDDLEIISEPEENKSEHETFLFKDAYKDSYFFDELQMHEPLEWVNIPRPLQLVLNSMKKCLVSNNRQLSEVTDKVHFLTTRYKKRLESHDDEIFLLRRDLKSAQDGMVKLLAESKQILNNDLQEFKKQIQKDLDYKQKIIDGKFSFIDDQVFNIKKYVNSLPTSDEIDKNIKNTIDRASETLKEELIKEYIQPDIKSLKAFTNSIFDTVNNIKNEFEEFKQKYHIKIEEIDKNSSVTYHMLSDSIKTSEESLKAEIIKIEDFFKNKNERHKQSIEALTSSYHELNHKFSLEFKSHQKEIDSQKHRIHSIFEEMVGIKKEVKELREIEEKIYRDLESQQVEISKDSSEYFSSTTHQEHTNINSHDSNAAVNTIDKSILCIEENLNKVEEKLTKIEDKNSHEPDSAVIIKSSPSRQNKATDPPQAPQANSLNPLNPLNPQNLPNPSNPLNSRAPIHLQDPNEKLKQKTSNTTRLSSKTKKGNSQPPNEDYFTALSNLQKYVNKKIDLFETKLNREIYDIILPLEEKLKTTLAANQIDFTDIKQKLSWLPINFSQIKGKDPTEARLFTIEARLRTEENARLEAFNKCMAALSSFSMTNSPTFEHEFTLPPIRTLSTTHERNFSQDSGIISELRKHTESEFGKKDNITSVFSSSMDISPKGHYMKKFSLRETMRPGFRDNSFLSRK